MSVSISVLAAPSAVIARRAALRPFPTSVGILLAISLSAHLAALVYVVAGQGLIAALSFGVGQFALSLGLLRLYNGAWVFQDIRVLLILFFFLYGFSLPAVAIARATVWAGLTEAAFLYGTAFAGFNLVQWWYKQPWRDVSPESLAWMRPTFANAAVVLLGFGAIVAYAWLKGMRTFLTLDRSQMNWLYTQTWVVSMMMMNGFAMYLFAGWPRLSRQAKWLVGATLFAFVIFHLGLGNRRDFISMFMFLLAIFASRRRATVGWKTILFAFITFVMFMLVGVVRQVRSAPSLLYTPDMFTLVAEQNEFVVPIRTVLYYVTADLPLHYGMTYLAAPSVFIPRVLWPEKPVGLSQQFNKDQFGDAVSIGFAYTPVTEAYINFSMVGPFMVMSLVSLATVFLVRHARRRPMLYFVCFALALEFNRGSSAGVLYFLVVVGVAFAIMKLISRIEWAPQALEAMWPSESSEGRIAGA